MLRHAASLLLGLVLGLTGAGTFTAEHTSEPPHAALPAAGVTQDPGRLIRAAEDVQQLIDQAREDERATLATTTTSRVRPPVPRVTEAAPTGTCPGDWAIPPHIVWRESHCDFEAINHTGCYDATTGITWTCVGAYQFDLRHWDAASGWGGCADLGDWHDPANQHECARRLSRDGTNLQPWGG